jgi:hypothetical protein
MFRNDAESKSEATGGREPRGRSDAFRNVEGMNSS